MLRVILKSLRHGFHSQGTCKLFENTLCTEETNTYLPFKRLIYTLKLKKSPTKQHFKNLIKPIFFVHKFLQLL